MSVLFGIVFAACNIMVFGAEGVYTLRNHGETGNCSILAISPATVRILDLDVGQSMKRGPLSLETGTIHHVSLLFVSLMLPFSNHVSYWRCHQQYSDNSDKFYSFVYNLYCNNFISPGKHSLFLNFTVLFIINLCPLSSSDMLQVDKQYSP